MVRLFLLGVRTFRLQVKLRRRLSFEMRVGLKFLTSKLLWICVAFFALSISSFAAPITLTNGNFDTDTTSTFIAGTVSGWTPNTTEYGVWNTTGTGGALAPLSASNVLYLSTMMSGNFQVDGSVSQTTTVAAIAGETYTFTIEAAKRNGLINPVAFRLELYDEAFPTSAFAVQNFTASALSATQWNPFTVSGTAIHSGNVSVRITLDSTGVVLPGATNPDMNKFQVIFDDASLVGPDAAGVPEPMTMSLIGGGLAGLALLRRRQKQ
jgi:hypothetical protein